MAQNMVFAEDDSADTSKDDRFAGDEINAIPIEAISAADFVAVLILIGSPTCWARSGDETTFIKKFRGVGS